MRWDVYNIKLGDNDKFTKDGDEVTVPKGYYTFSTLKKFLDAKGITIERNADGRVSLTADENVNLKKFGQILGFRENQSIPKDSQVNGKHPVSFSLGLTEIDVHCSLVDSFKNFDHKGEPSNFLLSIPIDTTQPLFGAITHYDFQGLKIPCTQYYGHDVEFEVFSSEGSTEYDYKIYIRMCIEGE